MSSYCRRYSFLPKEKKSAGDGALFFILENLEEKTDRNGYELNDATLRRIPRDAVIARFDERRYRTETERGPKTTIEADIVVSFCAAYLRFGVVVSGACYQIRLSGRAGERENQIHKTANDPCARRRALLRCSVFLREVIVHAVKANTDREIGGPDGESDGGVIARCPSVAELRNRDCRTTRHANRVGLLG
jgi:hypothetical protein